MGHFCDFHVLNTSKEGSRFVSKVWQENRDTLAPFLGFTVQGDSWTVNTLSFVILGVFLMILRFKHVKGCFYACFQGLKGQRAHFSHTFSVHGPRRSWAVNTLFLGYFDDFLMFNT